MCRKILMLFLFFPLVFSAHLSLAQERPLQQSRRQGTPEQESDRFFERYDANNDGKLSKDEFPRQLRRTFDRVDADQDGLVTKQEDIAFRKARNERNARNRIPAGSRILKDIAYVADGHERQRLDLYLPPVGAGVESPERWPLVIWIHGGGWRNGSKQNCPARFLLNHGFAVASINYRLSSHAQFPAQIEDCQRAVQFLRDNANKYSLDPHRFGAWGSSAGGHLVALLGTSRSRSFVPPEGSKTSSRIQAVCDYFGPIDFLKMNAQSGPGSRIDHDDEQSPESLLLGGPLQDRKEKANEASPATYISADDPPFLIVHGDNDQLVPHQQSRDFHRALTEAGVDAALHIVKGGGHGGFDETPRVLKFFQSKLQSPDAFRGAVEAARIFQASFDGTTDANLFGDDGWIYTADSIQRKNVKRGNHCAEVTLARAAGVSGDCLRFSAKTKKVLFYKAVENRFVPRPNWQGTISFWLKLDPDKDLEKGFCDPIQITQRKWNDGAIWVDFEDKSPRTFRLGVFSDFAKWNPENKKFDEIPGDQKPLVTVDNPPFASDRWTHVAITFSHLNSDKDQVSVSNFYLDGKLHGSIRKQIDIHWVEPNKEKNIPEPAIMLGLNYIGDMDELSLYNRALNKQEIQFLHHQNTKQKTSD